MCWRWGFLLWGVATAATTCADDLPTGVVDTQNPQDVSLSPTESLSRMAVPDGFHVTLFAAEPDIRRPIAFDIDDRGRLWVVECYAHPVRDPQRRVDRIVILDDSDGDGRFDHRKIFWDRGRYLSAIAVGHGGVWIGDSPELLFIPDRDGDDVPDADPIVHLNGFANNTNNMLNNFHWGPDGWLYGAQGDPRGDWVGRPDALPEERIEFARGIWRYHPTRHVFEIVADGMVNPWGADFNRYGDLFTVNTVLAHLWHIVPGMRCQRRGVEQGKPYTYRFTQSIADHLHWGGGLWRVSAEHDLAHAEAGGGHAHCGAMIYQGNNWPPKYRHALFTVNMHGNRINCDRLVPRGSSYVGVHAPDMLLANDRWFRGLTIKYGPDGGVFVSDWHDLGECHDQDGSHRSSGRIYKIVHRPRRAADEASQHQTLNLEQRTQRELVDLHGHENEWFVRHARRILHERAAGGEDLEAARERLATMFATEEHEEQKLRAMWTLYVIGGLSEAHLLTLLDHPQQHVRKWAVYLLMDCETINAAASRAMADLAVGEQSQPVRLALAAALQKMPSHDRWKLAAALLSHADDRRDAYLPLLVWYGVEPLVSADRERALEMARQGEIPLVTRLIARRAVDQREPELETVIGYALAEPRREHRLAALGGIAEVLQGRGSVAPPPSWQRLERVLAGDPDDRVRAEAARLATIFGDERALSQLKEKLFEDSLPLTVRQAAFSTLVRLDDTVTSDLLHRVIDECAELRGNAISALIEHGDDSTPAILIGRYGQLTPQEKQKAVGILATRSAYAKHLLDALEEGRIDRRDVSAFALQRLRSLSDANVLRRVEQLWADDATHVEKSGEIARYKALLTKENLAAGNEIAGRAVFARACASCHRLWSEGGQIGPELTGSARRNLDYLLTHLVDPNSLVDAAYRVTRIETVDGRLLTGFIVEHSEFFRVLRTVEGDVRLAVDEVEHMETLETSLMPEGILQSLGDDEVRDLILYLRMAEPNQQAGLTRDLADDE